MATATENTVTVKKHKPINRPRMDRIAPRACDVLDLIEQVADHGDKVVYRYYVGKEIKSITYIEFHEMIHACAAGFDAMDNMKIVKVDALVVGTGAAGYNAACRLRQAIFFIYRPRI